MKLLKDNEGSTLMLILITIAILAMLGTALLSMSLMNVTMKSNEKRLQSTQYLAESGIDQAYGIVGKFVEDAIKEGINRTNTDMKALLTELDAMVNYVNPATNLVDPTAHPNYSGGTGIGQKYLDADFSLKIDALENESNRLYKSYFTSYIDGLVDPTDHTKHIVGHLFATYDYKTVDPGGVKPVVTLTGPVQKFSASAPDARGVRHFIIRGVTSEFVQNGTKKVIATDMVITDEIKSYPLNTVENRITVKDNPLWQQALVATDNIEIRGNANLYVRGDVYGYGKLPAAVASGGVKVNDAAPTDFGGVLFKDTSRTTIDGNLYSRQYVQLAENSNSRLDILNGAIYADTVITQKGSDGVMTIKGNVYTKDDLEMNGRNADIEIQGSYYGYTDGSNAISNTASSAIVINSDTVNNTPRLSISGTEPQGNQVHKESTHGVMIGGTGYIDEVIYTNPSTGVNTRYQMAESLAFRENGLAYTWAFGKELIDTIIADASSPYVTKVGSRYMFYATDSEQDTQLRNYLDLNNVKWHPISNYTNLAVGTNVTGAGITSQFGGLNEKKAIFATFQDYVDTSGSLVRKGSGKVSVSNYIYTTGLQLNGSKFEYTNANQGIYETLRKSIEDDYLYQLHKMTPRNGLEIRNTTGSAIGKINPAVIEDVGGLDEATIDNLKTVKKYAKITAASAAYAYDASGAMPQAYNISNASADDLHIYGGVGTNTQNALYLNNQRTRVIVVRAGDIYLHGNIAVEGAIISDKSIYIEDNADVDIDNLSHDSTSTMKEDLARFIYSNFPLLDVFNVTNFDGGGVVNLRNIEFNKIETLENAYDPANNSVFTYYDWIYFEHWKVVQ